MPFAYRLDILDLFLFLIRSIVEIMLDLAITLDILMVDSPGLAFADKNDWNYWLY